MLELVSLAIYITPRVLDLNWYSNVAFKRGQTGHKVKHVKLPVIRLALSSTPIWGFQVPFELPTLLPLSPGATEEVGADVLN